MTTRSRRPRRKFLWMTFGTATVSLAASAVVAADLSSLVKGSMPSLSNFTLVRVRALWGVRPTATTTFQRYYDAGMLWVTEAAFQAGGVPDPENDDVSWLWRQTLAWHPGLIRETGAGVFTLYSMVAEIDNKAMRRVDELDQSLVFVVKNRQSVTSDFYVEGRALLKLT